MSANHSMKYRLLGKTGLLVSELCLGTMTFGGVGHWEAMGKVGQDAVSDIVARSIEAGINFIDTADVYSFGESEKLLGNALQSYSRDRFVLATKVRGRTSDDMNGIGLTRYHIMHAVEASLKRLQTDHIDLYQIHGFDYVTPIEETLRALDDLVKQGKVRYIGASNLAAWQLMKALGISERLGLARFESVQAYYTIASRELEREIIPLVEDQQVGVMVWSPLAGGLLSGKYNRDGTSPEGSRRLKFDFPIVDKDRAFDTVDVMREIAAEVGSTVAQVALAWLLHQKAVTSVVIGAKNADQLNDNLKAVDVTLSDDQLARLNAVSEIPSEYPQWMIQRQQGGRTPNDTPAV